MKYDEKEAQETIKRLKNDLLEAQIDNIKGHAKDPTRNPTDVKMIDDTCRLLSNHDSVKKQLERENKMLRDRFKKTHDHEDGLGVVHTRMGVDADTLGHSRKRKEVVEREKDASPRPYTKSLVVGRQSVKKSVK